MPLRLGSSTITLRLGTQAVTAYLGSQLVSATVPGAPEIANEGQGLFVYGNSFVLQWDAAGGDGGSPILGFFVYVDGDRLPNQLYDLVPLSLDGTASEATIVETEISQTQLRGSDVTVSAFNAVGEGPQSVEIVPQ